MKPKKKQHIFSFLVLAMFQLSVVFGQSQQEHSVVLTDTISNEKIGLITLDQDEQSKIGTAEQHWQTESSYIQLLDTISIYVQPCEKSAIQKTIPLSKIELLDRSYVEDAAIPPGIELRTLYALGDVKATVKQSATSIVISLTAESHGYRKDKDSECFGGLSAYLTVEVFAHYSSSQSENYFFVPTPDLRLAVQTEKPIEVISGFKDYTLGRWIRLGEPPFFCGERTPFTLRISEHPVLSFNGWLNQDGSNGTFLGLYVLLRGQVCGCLDDPTADGEVKAGANVESSTATTIQIQGSTRVKPICIKGTCLPERTFPFNFDLPLPTAAISKIPIDLPTNTPTHLEFGSFDGVTWKPSTTPFHKEIPIILNAGSFGGSSTGNSTFVIDGWVGNRRTATVDTPQTQRQIFESDYPMWEGRQFGVTVRNSFFGGVGKNIPPTGLFGTLLPIRVQGEMSGRFLIFRIRKKYEIVLDGAQVHFGTHENGPAIQVSLTASYVRIGNAKPVFGHGNPIKKVSGLITFDRLRFEDRAIRFRVADFRLKIGLKWIGIPIKLSSGQLESLLNNGSIPITDDPQVTVTLPKCIYTAYEKFVSGPDTCDPIPQIGFLGYERGPRTGSMIFDMSSFAVRRQEFSLGQIQWEGLQVSARFK